jgi:hypothetical protein
MAAVMVAAMAAVMVEAMAAVRNKYALSLNRVA